MPCCAVHISNADAAACIIKNYTQCETLNRLQQLQEQQQQQQQLLQQQQRQAAAGSGTAGSPGSGKQVEGGGPVLTMRQLAKAMRKSVWGGSSSGAGGSVSGYESGGEGGEGPPGLAVAPAG